VHRSGALVSDYGFDDNGNRTTHRVGPASPLRGKSWPCLGTLPAGGDVTVSGSYDAQDRMSSYGSCSYEYTRNGELTRRVDSATSSTTEYEYDEFGNLRRVVLPDTRVITYHIDGLNRRVGKSINGVRQWGLLYANQLEPVAELDADGNVIASFIYADRPHVPSLMLKGGQTYRMLADHLGSVRLVVNIATGAIAQRMAYDEYGNVVEDTNPGFQPFGYAGGIYDRDTGLVRFGARDYDAVAGRWTAKDPIGFRGGDENFFAYVASDPVNAIDPEGYSKISAIKEALKEVYARVGGRLPKAEDGKWGSPQRGDSRRGYRYDREGHPKSDDPNEAGPHINWWDYSEGKRKAGTGKKGAVPIKESGAAATELLLVLIPWPLFSEDLGCPDVCGRCAGIPCNWDSEIEADCDPELVSE
jgi:RHS repeat-associated protein